jgi:hypothetical protein
MLMLGLRLIHHSHSGKLRPHEHTSYLPLGIILAVVGFGLITYTASATPASPGPDAGSIGLSGVMPAKPPTLAATIKTPTDGQHFSTSPVTISGTCLPDNLVEIFKNDIFAGSALCTSGGTYSFDIDLLTGANSLLARVYDALNQPGPDSNKPTVYYDGGGSTAAPLVGLNFGGPQLLLNTDAVYRGVFPDQELSMPIDVIGGTPPFAVNTQWGDGNNTNTPRGDNSTFRAPHIYTKAGNYKITLQATDATGRVAFLTVAAIVNGQPSTVANTSTGATGSSDIASRLLILWPLYVGTLVTVVSFWLGERREKHILKKRGQLLST